MLLPIPPQGRKRVRTVPLIQRRGLRDRYAEGDIALSVTFPRSEGYLVKRLVVHSAE